MFQKSIITIGVLVELQSLKMTYADLITCLTGFIASRRCWLRAQGDMHVIVIKLTNALKNYLFINLYVFVSPAFIKRLLAGLHVPK